METENVLKRKGIQANTQSNISRNRSKGPILLEPDEKKTPINAGQNHTKKRFIINSSLICDTMNHRGGVTGRRSHGDPASPISESLAMTELSSQSSTKDEVSG